MDRPRRISAVAAGAKLGSFQRLPVLGVAYVTAGQRLGSYIDTANVQRPILGVHRNGPSIPYIDTAGVRRWSQLVSPSPAIYRDGAGAIRTALVELPA